VVAQRRRCICCSG